MKGPGSNDQPFSAEAREQMRAAVRAIRERTRDLTDRALITMSVSKALHAKSEASLKESRQLLDELQGSISAYVHVMRQLGETPDRVIELVGDIADDAAKYIGRVDRGIGVGARALRGDMIRWTINAYYAASP